MLQRMSLEMAHHVNTLLRSNSAAFGAKPT